jgi:hypothetical protein
MLNAHEQVKLAKQNRCVLIIPAHLLGLAAAENPGDSRLEARILDLPLRL